MNQHIYHIWYFVPVTDFDWVLKAMGKRQAIGSMGGHGFDGQNLNGFGWLDISGHLQNGYGPSRFIKQSDWVGMFQQDTYNY